MNKGAKKIAVCKNGIKGKSDFYLRQKIPIDGTNIRKMKKIVN